MANRQPICSIPNCGKGGQLRRGWCEAHYRRWRIHGDPLGGTPDRASRRECQRFYRDIVVPNAGDECLIWPFARDTAGYACLRIDRILHRVHRLVCEDVHGDAPSVEYEAAHSCGKGHFGCVNPNHLSWKTRSGNMADKLEHGTDNRGERNNMAKLTEDDVIAIRSLAGSMNQYDLAAKFGVSQSNISLIVTGRKWGWLET